MRYISDRTLGRSISVFLELVCLGEGGKFSPLYTCIQSNSRYGNDLYPHIFILKAVININNDITSLQINVIHFKTICYHEFAILGFKLSQKMSENVHGKM